MPNKNTISATSLASPPSRARILVVDDEQRIRDACFDLLTAEGYEVELATDGSRGLERIESAHFDIILLDLMMPNVSGFDVLAKARALHPDTVVIVITGYATLEHSIEAMKSGAFDFIPKPFNPDQLRMVVEKAITHIRALWDIATTQSRLRVLVNRLSDGVMATDDTQKAVLANPAFLQMIGYSGQGVIGCRVDSFIDNGRILELIGQALTMPSDEFTELRGEIRLNGEDSQPERILNVRCLPFRDRRQVTVGTITVLHDITTLKKIDQLKSDFVSMVSHEIRSPMNSVLMQLKVILDGLAGEVSEKQRDMLGRASEKIENLVSMASELLDLARIESGLITQEKQKIEVAPLVEDQIEFHRAKAQIEGIRLQLEPLPELPPILANRQNIEEVLSNLLGNAIKYTPSGGKVAVSAAMAETYICIEVQDNGYGIAEQDLSKIFNRFYRVKDENTRFIHGTGLGLAIVKSIIDAHQGRIEVDSTPGAGSAFRVYLPYCFA